MLTVDLEARDKNTELRKSYARSLKTNQIFLWEKGEELIGN